MTNKLKVIEIELSDAKGETGRITLKLEVYDVSTKDRKLIQSQRLNFNMGLSEKYVIGLNKPWRPLSKNTSQSKN